jgi:hypothetical protein
MTWTAAALGAMQEAIRGTLPHSAHRGSLLSPPWQISRLTRRASMCAQCVACSAQLTHVRAATKLQQSCNTTDILSSPCNNRAAFPTHSSASTEKLGATNCNTTDILSSPCNNRASFPTHSSASTEKLGACNQQFQRTNVYSKASTLIINITQPSLNNSE